MKVILFSFLFLFFISVVSAGTDIVGTGGNEWNGNVSFENSIAYNSTGYVYPRPYPDIGLIHYWPIENGSGTVLYDEVGGDDATINGGTWNASGVSGYCIDLDGSNGGIDIGKDYDLDNFSISLYVRFNNFTSPDNYAATFGNYVEYFGMAISNTRYQYQNRNSSEYNTIDNSSIDLSGWSNINHLRNNATGLFSLYIDNSFSGSDTIIGPLYDLNGNFYFGAKDDGTNNRLNGSMDELRIYNTVLNSGEIASVYNIEYYLSSNTTRNYTSLLGVGEEVQTIQFNGSAPDATMKYTIRASTDGITYDIIQLNASTYPTTYDISGNGYGYVMIEQNTSDATQALILYNITGIYGATSNIEVDVNITYWNPGSGGLVATYNITNITPGVSSINILLNVTRDTWNYSLTYSNGTFISNQTATYENEPLNFSIPLVEDSYNITESSTISTSTIIVPANSWCMFNNWTANTTFSAIATNESNDVAYSYYNVSSGLWESYWPGYSWNTNNNVETDNSVMAFFNAETTITALTITPSSTELYTGWNMLFVQSTDNETLIDIKADIGANCTAVWWYDSSADAYSDTGADTVQPNQGFLAYLTQGMTWTRSDL